MSGASHFATLTGVLSRKIVFAATVLIACAAATAWQSALSAVGWSEDRSAKMAESFFTGSRMLPGGGAMSAEVKQRWIGKAPGERAQAIRELALQAKRYVQTPAFEKLHAQWIKDRYDAVNHGIKVEPNAAVPADRNAAMSEMASVMAESFQQVPPEALKLLIANDIDSLKADAKNKPLLDRLRRVESLLKTDPAGAKKQYALTKAMQMSGQTNEADTQATLAAGAKAAAERKRLEQQRSWNEHNLKADLRRRLTAFLAMAESVDFSAPTQRNAGKQVFTDPKLEGKSADWKLLYRLGKEPTQAAVDVAKQWLREL